MRKGCEKIHILSFFYPDSTAEKEAQKMSDPTNIPTILYRFLLIKIFFVNLGLIKMK